MFLFSTAIASANDNLTAWHNTALATVKEEKSVLDAYWRNPQNNILHVARQFDGSRHDGFAQYLCLTINKGDAPADTLKTIWIYDPINYERAKTTSGEAMGMAVCR